jgi:dephospho-CoA kinase
VEKGFIDISDIIIVTVASEDVQISRLMQRYSIDKEQALRRIKMQKSEADYLSIGDIILNTDKTDQGDLMTFIDMFENTYIKSVKD